MGRRYKSIRLESRRKSVWYAPARSAILESSRTGLFVDTPWPLERGVFVCGEGVSPSIFRMKGPFDFILSREGLRESSNPLTTTGTKTMNALEVIQRFIDAFNRHDADAVNALYAEGRPTIVPALTTL
jgi:hypothetical protein